MPESTTATVTPAPCESCEAPGRLKIAPAATAHCSRCNASAGSPARAAGGSRSAVATTAAQQVRFAATSRDCPVNPGCIPGLKSVYGLDPTSVFVPLAVAGSGISALDDGVAEVGIA